MEETPTEIVCPVCDTSVKSGSRMTIKQFSRFLFGGYVEHYCPTCSAPFKKGKIIAKTGIVIGLYIFAVLTIVFGCVLGFVTISVWAIKTGYLSRTEISQPSLFVSACSIIWFSLVVGMILIALGRMVDNSDVQKYYTIARFKRNSASSLEDLKKGYLELISQLDEMYEADEISETVYQKIREEQKAKLSEVMGNLAKE